MDVPNTSRSNAACLIGLLSFIDGVQYNTAFTFSHEQLLAVTVNQVAAYLNNKAYGTPTPGPNYRPHQGRSNSLAFHKKVIYHFIPLCTMQWDDIHLQGNPTCSTAVNDVIAKERKFGQTRGCLQSGLFPS